MFKVIRMKKESGAKKIKEPSASIIRAIGGPFIMKETEQSFNYYNC